MISTKQSVQTVQSSLAALSQRRLHERIGIVLGALLVLSLVLALPPAIGSILAELITPPQGVVYPLTETAGPMPPGLPGAAVTPAESHFDLAVLDLDEEGRKATLQVSGYRTCLDGCPAMRLKLFALNDPLTLQGGVPPSAQIDVPAATRAINATVTLPVVGQPLLYPFGTYELRLGSAPAEVMADGRTITVDSGLELERYQLTVQARLSRLVMLPPAQLPPSPQRRTELAGIARVTDLKFQHPLYLRVLTVVLVTLVTIATVLNVTAQAPRQMLVGVGSLVLGVWGIRQVLVPAKIGYITTVELLLSAVILVLLYGLLGRLVLGLIRGTGNAASAGPSVTAHAEHADRGSTTLATGAARHDGSAPAGARSVKDAKK